MIVTPGALGHGAVLVQLDLYVSTWPTIFGLLAVGRLTASPNNV